MNTKQKCFLNYLLLFFIMIRIPGRDGKKASSETYVTCKHYLEETYGNMYFLYMMGDGYCDHTDDILNLNVEACNYDNGDCCEASCDPYAFYDCGSYMPLAGNVCIDPDYVDSFTDPTVETK
jgi:hypothetical protein